MYAHMHVLINMCKCLWYITHVIGICKLYFLNRRLVQHESTDAYVCTYARVYLYICVYVCVLYMHLNCFAYKHIQVTNIYRCIRMYKCMCLFVHMCVCLCLIYAPQLFCLQTYTRHKYIQMHTYAHMHVSICTYMSVSYTHQRTKLLPMGFTICTPNKWH